MDEVDTFPIRRGSVRFAVGHPHGLTSNSWKMWATKAGDVYLACRDNFNDTKVSLHASGRWRMGFTTEAVARAGALVATGGNRAWDIWDEPPPSLPGTAVAFRLFFATSELAVRPEQRTPREWKDVIFVEAGPPGKLTILSLFITVGDPVLTGGQCRRQSGPCRSGLHDAVNLHRSKRHGRAWHWACERHRVQVRRLCAVCPITKGGW